MRFLLIDDNEINLEVEKLMLESCGLEVFTAESGAEAVEMAAETDFFMILMDIHMPEMDGFTAAEIIRRNNKDTVIIALSADEIPETDPDFVRSGMNGSVRKPLQMSELKELLSRYITPESLPGGTVFSGDTIFSYDELIAVIKSERSVYRLVKQFLTVHGKDCELLNEYIRSGSFTGAREILHNMIGISGNMFCKRLYSVSCRLSTEIKRDCCDSLEAFNAIWDETFAELTECCRRLSDSSDPENVPPDWSKLKDEFFALCSDFDVAAADIFSENTSIFRTNMSDEDFGKLKEAVLRYDFMWICDNMEAFNV